MGLSGKIAAAVILIILAFSFLSPIIVSYGLML